MRANQMVFWVRWTLVEIFIAFDFIFKLCIDMSERSKYWYFDNAISRTNVMTVKSIKKFALFAELPCILFCLLMANCPDNPPIDPQIERNMVEHFPTSSRSTPFSCLTKDGTIELTAKFL